MLKMTHHTAKEAAFGNTSHFFQCTYKGKSYRGTVVLVPTKGNGLANVISNASDRALAYNSGVRSAISIGVVAYIRKLGY